MTPSKHRTNNTPPPITVKDWLILSDVALFLTTLFLAVIGFQTESLALVLLGGSAGFAGLALAVFIVYYPWSMR